MPFFARGKFPREKRKVRALKKQRILLLIMPAMVSIIVFSIIPAVTYLPAAVRNWMPPMPISFAKYVGLRWFKEILNYYGLPELIRNSLILGIWDIILLPIPLILALATHHCGSHRIKMALDIFSLIPVFIPSVIVVAITQKILCTEGLLNQFLSVFGIPLKNHLLNGKLFYAYFSLSGLWSSLGFPCLVYKSCLTGSSRELHDAAQLDGAGLLMRITKIDLPLCKSTFLINLTIQIANILATNTERLLLFKNTANSSYATTLDLYAYELTFKSSLMPSYSKAIALGLMITAVNAVLLFIARKATERAEHIYE